jgi:hypothetical protein
VKISASVERVIPFQNKIHSEENFAAPAAEHRRQSPFNNITKLFAGLIKSCAGSNQA